mmetsp:Transcript_20649/g.57006  ORF Transcript_20649/g.57006 Transcript_20649/m.57006 type:complete len:315 (-) Transcript_20649:440-1384(-)
MRSVPDLTHITKAKGVHPGPRNLRWMPRGLEQVLSSHNPEPLLRDEPAAVIDTLQLTVGPGLTEALAREALVAPDAASGVLHEGVALLATALLDAEVPHCLTYRAVMRVPVVHGLHGLEDDASAIVARVPIVASRHCLPVSKHPIAERAIPVVLISEPATAWLRKALSCAQGPAIACRCWSTGTCPWPVPLAEDVALILRRDATHAATLHDAVVVNDLPDHCIRRAPTVLVRRSIKHEGAEVVWAPSPASSDARLVAKPRVAELATSVLRVLEPIAPLSSQAFVFTTHCATDVLPDLAETHAWLVRIAPDTANA